MTLLTVKKLTTHANALSLPQQLLDSLGWQEGQTIDFDAFQKHLAKIEVPSQPDNQAIEAFIAQASGMVVIDPKNAPKGDLLDFEAGEYVTLFDNTDD